MLESHRRSAKHRRSSVNSNSY